MKSRFSLRNRSVASFSFLGLMRSTLTSVAPGFSGSGGAGLAERAWAVQARISSTTGARRATVRGIVAVRPASGFMFEASMASSPPGPAHPAFDRVHDHEQRRFVGRVVDQGPGGGVIV